MAQGWSSLSADLVNCIADCLLATNDLDCYTALRAVCHHWRSVTADPRSNQHDPRFRPSRWVMLDEPEIISSTTTDDGTFLFVNTATGRFLRRSLPLLRGRDSDSEYVFVTSTTGGLIILAAREPPHAVSVLDPFTGSLLRFAAPLPRESGPRLRLTADVVGSSPTLVLVSVGRSLVYWAEPQSERFSDMRHPECPASRLPLIAASVKNKSSVSCAKHMLDLLWSEDDDKDDDSGRRCYVVVAVGGDMLAVLKRHRGIDVFKIDAARNILERVKSIGSQALFLGARCLAVDADRFPTVEPNCAYFEFTERRSEWCRIYKVNIGIYDDEQEPELVSAAVYTDKYVRPLTLTQLLSNYTMDIPSQPLTWKMCSDYIMEVDYYDSYIDYVDDESDEDCEYYLKLDDHDYYPAFEEYL